MRTRIAALVSVLLLLAALVAPAQDATGRVAGVVTDPTGAVVAGAKVTVTNVATGVSRETTTDADGSYQVLQLPIGSYRIGVEAPGFRKVVTGQEQLRINETLRMDATLEVG